MNVYGLLVEQEEILGRELTEAEAIVYLKECMNILNESSTPGGAATSDTYIPSEDPSFIAGLVQSIKQIMSDASISMKEKTSWLVGEAKEHPVVFASQAVTAGLAVPTVIMILKKVLGMVKPNKKPEVVKAIKKASSMPKKR